MDNAEVVLLSELGEAIGVASKVSVHGPDTPLHLAFSCYVLNERGDVLITRRALSKSAWPGVWSNSFCGHPAPAEPVLTAVHRRAAYEVGLELEQIELALPVFRYRAIDASNVVENEICPVYIASTSQRPTPHPGEVMDSAWVNPLDLGRSIRLTPSVFSPWLVLQAELLPLLGGSDHDLHADSHDSRKRVST
ncbi:MAG: isopentenyl-diphosphate Delta-isomerase [Lacisediminihabitans sp.]